MLALNWSKLCDKRWKDQISSTGTSNRSWSLSELQAALIAFESQQMSAKLFFLIDGLDEYYGESLEVISIMRTLAQMENVKICLSSRPWNWVHDPFESSSSNMLRLHELTKKDILLFAKESLVLHQLHVGCDHQIFSALVDEIGERAQGVFLWVRLAVRSLRDGLTNDDPVSILLERSRAIPSDLEEFFDLILKSVDPIYRTQMARTFMAALSTPQPMNLFHYWYLDHDTGPDQSLCLPNLQGEELENGKNAILTQRRLNGRFKGLLEPSSTNVIPATTVDFLHRTLRDFLAEGQMRQKLENWAGHDVNIFVNISRAFVAEAKYIDAARDANILIVAVRLMEQASATHAPINHRFTILDEIDLVFEQMSKADINLCCGRSVMCRAAIAVSYVKYMQHCLSHWQATTHELSGALKHAMSCSLEQKNTLSRFLALSDGQNVLLRNSGSCFIPAFSIPRPRFPEAVRILLERGADPFAMIGQHSAWDVYLSLLIEITDDEGAEQLWKVFSLLVTNHPPDPNQQAEHWRKFLDRKTGMSERSLQLTLLYFQKLNQLGLKPHTQTFDEPITQAFLRNLSADVDLPFTALSVAMEVLMELCRRGIDLNLLCSSPSNPGWLNGVTEQLTSPRKRDPYVTMVYIQAEIKILLEHGINPNSKIRGGSSLWEHLIGAINCGIKQESLGIAHLLRILILLLAYGTNPRVAGMSQLYTTIVELPRTKDLEETKEFHDAVQREIAHQKGQTQTSRKSHDSPPSCASSRRTVGGDMRAPAMIQHHGRQWPHNRPNSASSTAYAYSGPNPVASNQRKRCHHEIKPSNEPQYKKSRWT